MADRPTDSDRELAFLRHRLGQLEGELLDLAEQYRHEAADNARLRLALRELKSSLSDVTESARWRTGDRLIRWVEIAIGRKRQPLAVDYMAQLLEQCEVAAPRRRLRTAEDARWRPQVSAAAGSHTGEPLGDHLKPIAADRRGELTFFRWLNQAKLQNAEQRLIDAVLDSEWRELEHILGAARLAPYATAPLVSVIMPSYNRAAVIGDAVRSVLEQSYPLWQLLVCDDGSSDATRSVIEGFGDSRVRRLELPHRGAAAARNAGLAAATGQVIAYLDSDNLWHPHYLAAMLAALLGDCGRLCAYSAYLDMEIRGRDVLLRSGDSQTFSYERLSEKNFIDLNAFLHWRELYDCFGGFTDDLARQQDWDLALKYCFLRDPLLVDQRLTLYRRNADWAQITHDRRIDQQQAADQVRQNLDGYYRRGLPAGSRTRRKPTLTVLIWDICRNHFSKAYNLAEALAADYDVQLIGFRFFDEPIFPPYAKAEPAFETLYFDGGDFPDFSATFSKALAAIRGELIYCVKPRLPSLGLALLAHYHFATPFVVEVNDLESAVTAPDLHAGGEDAAVLPAPDDPSLRTPHDPGWTRYLESLLPALPLKVTHNENLNRALGSHCLFVRNPKDETIFDPARHDRAAERRRLGVTPEQKVVLFAGLVRRHKGVFQLREFIDRAPPEYTLLVVGSRRTPDLDRLRRRTDHGRRLKLLPAQDRNAMAAVTCAADAVVLWLDPDTPASHYQTPFKLTDALALGLPLFANPIADLAELGRQGYLELVPFGDLDRLLSRMQAVFDAGPEALAERRERLHRLYRRQFSYAAVRANFALLVERAARFPRVEAAAEFAARLAACYQHWSRDG